MAEISIASCNQNICIPPVFSKKENDELVYYNQEQLQSESNIDISISPNPASNKIFVSIRCLFPAEGKVWITNETGNIVARREVTQSFTAFDTEAMPAGMYLLTFENQLNHVTKKFVLVK